MNAPYDFKTIDKKLQTAKVKWNKLERNCKAQ